MTWLSVVFAALAGVSFAVAGVLQQDEASTRPSGESLSPRLLVDLATSREWLTGIGLAVLSYGFQSLALVFGPLALVQPVMISEIVFAIPLSARLHHARVGGRTLLGAAAVAAGLGLALGMSSPGGGDPTSASLGGWLLTVGVVAVIAAAAVTVFRFSRGVLSASALAVAAASVMGTQSALLALTLENLQAGIVPLLTAWQTYLLVAASVVGLLLIQSAFQAGPLAASLPVFDAVEPAVAVSIGVLLFGEALSGSPWRLGVAGLGAVLAVVGIFVVDTAPAIRRLHRKEQREQQPDSAEPAGAEP